MIVGLANGKAPSAIGAEVQADTLTMRHLEASIKAKLGAKTHPHMIARGFTLGVLFPRALCMLLAVLSAAESGHDAFRTRSQRRSRTPATYTRITRTSATGGRGIDKVEAAKGSAVFVFESIKNTSLIS
ncbi:hypothetical protein D3C77_635480 [compost metagenome]